MGQSRNERTDAPGWVQALLDKSLTPVELRVWLYLHWRQGGNGSAWPSQATIATDLGLTTEGVRKIVGRLVEKGWLVIDRPAHTAPGRKLEYRVVVPANHPNGCLGEHPNGCLGDTANHPNGHTRITPTAKPGHKGRTHTGTHTSAHSAQRKRITYDWEHFTFQGIPEDFLHQWAEAYPGIDVEAEIRGAAAWVRSNQGKARRLKDWPRFLNNWLANAQRDSVTAGGNAVERLESRECSEAEAEAMMQEVLRDS